ncbi:DUF6933 domain-containing protein [Aliikangiella sp. IMCC44359]|uniref:DUF6933 domain-containing protein n=1 Tax=Aliikangiella sp. IMCC44359 TaxID=3459125 RepID=UPI00403AAFDD
MIKLHCTKKLQDKLTFDNEGLLPEGREIHKSIGNFMHINPLSGWHANLLKLHRRNCILMVHNQTRFPLLLTGLTKKEFNALDYVFADALMNTLLKVGADEDQMWAAQEALAPLSIQATNDRSVQGTLNQMSGDIEHLLYFDNVNVMDVSPYRASAWLADRPCNVKGQKDCIWPDKAMLQLLDLIGNNVMNADRR